MEFTSIYASIVLAGIINNGYLTNARIYHQLAMEQFPIKIYSPAL